MSITGHPPVSADHIYNFEKYLEAFPHPCPKSINTSGSTLPIAAPIIPANLQGWNDLDPSQRSQVQNLFSHTPENDLQLAYDQFIQSLGRAPLGVVEFFRFVLTFEGNELGNSPRKPLGDLFLQNAELRKTLHQQRSETMKITEFFHRILAMKDTLIEVLGTSRTGIQQRMDDLQKENRELKTRLDSVQQERDQLLQDHSTLDQNHV
ncbi:uncharacterized protein LOC144621075 [Crassostrea virginica]